MSRRVKSNKKSVNLFDVFLRRYNDIINRGDLNNNEKTIAINNNNKEYVKADTLYKNAKKDIKIIDSHKHIKRGINDFEYSDVLSIRDDLQAIVNYFDYLIMQERM